MPENKLFPYDTKYKSNKLTIAGIIQRLGSYDYSFDLSFFTGQRAGGYNPNDETLALTIIPESVNANTIEAVLNLDDTHMYVNNKFTNTGELSMIIKHGLRDVDFTIDDMGNLVVSGEDAKNYSIDSNGQLVYTTR